MDTEPWQGPAAVDHDSVFGGRPTVLGHRGLGKGVVGGLGENTRESLRQALRAGLRWVETDVRRTADDVLVVGHHPTLRDGSFVASLTLQQARALGALTLAEFLDGMPAEIGVNLDLKTSLEDALRPAERTTASLFAPVAAEIASRRRLLVSSFDPAALLHLRRLAPEVALGLLTWVGFPLRKAIPAAVHLGVEVVVAHWSSFGPNKVDPAPTHPPAEHSIGVAHKAGLEVMAWCPTAAQAAELLSAGIDAVIVDDVPSTLPALQGLAD
jgi:glycerophosphoryl diester phosphodiesterase